MRSRRLWNTFAKAAEKARSSERESSAGIRPVGSTSPSTSGSPQPDALLVLPVAGPLVVRLLGGRGEVLENNLREPLAHGQLERRRSTRVERGEGEGAVEPRVHLPERGDHALAGPRRAEPQRCRDV